MAARFGFRSGSGRDASLESWAHVYRRVSGFGEVERVGDRSLKTAARANDGLFGDVAGLIDGARARSAVAINSELVMLYWSVGKRVRDEVLGGERAAYGEQVIKELAARLTERYGRGWSRWNLERMMRLAAWLPDSEICAPLALKLTWTNIGELLTIPDQQKRDFYLAFCAHERWSKRALRAKVAGKLYDSERHDAHQVAAPSVESGSTCRRRSLW